MDAASADVLDAVANADNVFLVLCVPVVGIHLFEPDEIQWIYGAGIYRNRQLPACVSGHELVELGMEYVSVYHHGICDPDSIVAFIGSPRKQQNKGTELFPHGHFPAKRDKHGNHRHHFFLHVFVLQRNRERDFDEYWIDRASHRMAGTSVQCEDRHYFAQYVEPGGIFDDFVFGGNSEDSDGIV